MSNNIVNMLREADIAYRAKKYKDAKALYQSAIEHGADKALAHLGLSLSAFHLNEYDDAEAHALFVSEIRPDLYKPYLILAYIRSQKGNLIDAETEMRCALRISPESSDILSFGGGLLIAQNKLDEGYQMLQKAREQNPNDWMVYYNLGSLYLLKGKYSESAREYFASFKLRRSLSAAKRLLIVVGYIYRVPIITVLTVISLLAFYLRSMILLNIVTLPIIVVGLVALFERNKKGLLLILLGCIPLLLFFLTK